MSSSSVAHFDQVSYWLGKNCRFFNENIFIVQSHFYASVSKYENHNHWGLFSDLGFGSEYPQSPPWTPLVTQTLSWKASSTNQQRHLSRGFCRWIFLANYFSGHSKSNMSDAIFWARAGQGKKLRYLELIKSILYQSIRTRVHWGFPVLIRERGFRLTK